VSRHHEFFNSVVFKSAPTQQKARFVVSLATGTIQSKALISWSTTL